MGGKDINDGVSPVVYDELTPERLRIGFEEMVKAGLVEGKSRPRYHSQ